jgi:hypothetical protein
VTRDPELRGALLIAWERVGRLMILDPDPDRYDAGFNAAVERAQREIQRVALDLAGERARRDGRGPPPRDLPSSPMQRLILDYVTAHHPVREKRVRAALLKTLRPQDRPNLTVALDALVRAGRLRRLAGGHTTYTLPDPHDSIADARRAAADLGRRAAGGAD